MIISWNDPISMGEYQEYQLAAPASFWDATEDMINDLTGGCGPGGMGDFFVPDRILFLNMKPSCTIHDWCFAVWDDKPGFPLSNNIFKNNMVRQNSQHEGYQWLKRRRLKYIKLYYNAVKDFGESSYYSG